MISVQQLTVHYGVRPVLRNLNLELAAGELVAIVGPNGMGKSTLMAAMAGVLSPQAGRIVIDGHVRRSTPEAEREVRRRVAYLPEQSWLPVLKSGREFAIGVGHLYDIEPSRLVEHVDALLNLFELKTVADNPIVSYSTGQRKKIALCAVLAAEPKVLLLDEPFSGGIDPSAILALTKLLRRFASMPDRSVIFATPVPEIVEHLADRVVLLKHGEVVACDTIEALGKSVGEKHFARILEKIVHPDTSSNVESYLENWKW